MADPEVDDGTYEQLNEAWWTIHEAYAWCTVKKVRLYLVRVAFEALLDQVGWTVDLWNREVDERR